MIRTEGLVRFTTRLDRIGESKFIVESEVKRERAEMRGSPGK